jgi:hypothetical protein
MTEPNVGVLPWDELVVEATHYAAALEAALHAWVGTSPYADVDLDAGTIRFTGGPSTAQAPVQVIGTVDADDSSWLWGWDHPSVPDRLGRHAALVREYGVRFGLVDLTTRLVPVTETEPLVFAAVAALLAGAQGVTSLSLGRTSVFLTYGEVTVVADPPTLLPAPGVLGVPVPTEPSGIPTSGPWLTGPEPGTTPRQVLDFVRGYWAEMHPLYHEEPDDREDVAPSVWEQQRELQGQGWRRTDTFHFGGVRGSDGLYDLGACSDWCAQRVSPRLWQVTWRRDSGFGSVADGVLVMAFDDGLRLVDLLDVEAA